MSPSASAACFPAPAGLVGWWSGDNTTNDIVAGNNASLQGGAAYAPGEVASSFSFDGTNAFVQVPDSAVLKPANLTIECWVLFNSLDSAGTGTSPAGEQFLVVKQNSSQLQAYDLQKVRIAGGDVFSFSVASAAAQTVQVQSTAFISTGTWYHVAGVRGTNFIQLYVNGVLQGQTAVAFAQDYGAFPLYFGSTGQNRPDRYDHKLSGRLDEISIYNRPLSASEISQLWAAGSSGKCKQVIVTSSPSDQTLLVGGNAQFSVAATGLAPLNYQWQFNGSNVPGATTTLLTLNAVQPSQQGAYTVVVSNVLGAVTSLAANLTVLVPPGIMAQPQSVTNIAGTDARFTVGASGTSPLNYQWQFNSAQIASATGSSLTVPAVQPTNAGNYSVVITNVAGSLTSSVASLTVWVPPGIVAQPQSVTNIAGTDARFTVGASGSGPLNYQWQFNSALIAGATGSSLTVGGVQPTNAGNYLVVITNVAGSLTSSVATLTVWVPPAVTAQPQSVTNIAGTDARFTVGASGTSPLNYQWQFNSAPVASATGSALSVLAVQPTNAGNYSVALTNVAGSITSNVATLTVWVPPSISAQPQSQTNILGTPTAFTVAASGTAPLRFQWQFGGVPLPGATTSTFARSPVQTNDEGDYSVVVTNVAGSVTSDLAHLKVLLPPGFDSTNLPVNLTVEVGATTNFVVYVHGSSPLSFRWRKDGNDLQDNGHISGSRTPSLLITCVEPTDAGGYSVIVTNAAGSAQAIAVNLSVVRLVSIPDPQLEAAIQCACGKQGCPLTTFDLGTLTRLSATAYNITNLTGLELATNLSELYLSGDHLNDLAPLQNLSSLTKLSVHGQPRGTGFLGSDAPRNTSQLAGLTNLVSLELDENVITDLSQIANLNQLTRLSLKVSKLSSLQFVDKLWRLSELYLANNRLQDISAIGSLTNLTCLDLRWNAVTNPSALATATSLTRLYLGANSLSNLAFAAQLHGLTLLHVGENFITDTAPLAGLTNLTYLVLSGNPITNYAGLLGPTGLANLELRCNQISDLGPLGSLHALQYADLACNRISDASPLTAMGHNFSVVLDGNTNLTASSLGTLRNLSRLWINGTALGNAGFLGNLPQLITVGLANNNLGDFSPLNALTNLQVLDLSGNPGTDYTPLSGKTSLSVLQMEENSLVNTRFLRNLSQLKFLGLRSNLVQQLGDMSALPNLSSLYLDRNRITNVDVSLNLSQLRFFEVSRNPLNFAAGSAPSTTVDQLRCGGTGVTWLPTNRLTLSVLLQTAPKWYVPSNATRSLECVVSDDLVSPSEWSLTASSSNDSAVPNNGISITGTNGNQLLTITSSGQTQAASVVTMTVANAPGGLRSSTNLLVFLQPADSSFSFSDPNLSNAVWSALGLPVPQLTSVDLLNLPAFNGDSSALSDLTGLQWATNLVRLSVSSNNLSDLTPLQNLISLSELRVASNNITDLSPVAGLRQLRVLDASWNPLINPAPLSALTNLTELHLVHDLLTNLNFLSNLAGLNFLDAGTNKIADLSPLVGLTNLNILSLEQNHVTDISVVTNFPNLTYLDVRLNLIGTNMDTVVQALRNRGVIVLTQPQRTPPVIDVRTNWVLATGSTSSIPVVVADTGPEEEPLPIEVTHVLPAWRVALNPAFEPPGRGNWSLTVTNPAGPTVTNFITLYATNDVGLWSSRTITAEATALLPLQDRLLGQLGLIWTSSGDASWFGQGLVTRAGHPVAQAGAIGNSRDSLLQTSVTGPGRLTFWWRVSSEFEADALYFQVADNIIHISGQGGDWQREVINVPPGLQVLTWRYSKNEANSRGADSGWVDGVTFEPGVWLDLPEGPADNQANLVLHAIPGRVYAVQVNTNLTTGPLNKWVPLQPLVAVTNTTMNFIDTNALSSTRLYRLREVTPLWFSSTTRLPNGSFQFVLQNVAGLPYTLESSTDLSLWRPVATNTSGATTVTNVDTSVTNSPRRFYRTVTLP